MNPYNSQSESFKRLNPHIFPQVCADTAKSLLDSTTPPKKRLRQKSSGGLNKLESDFLVELNCTHPIVHVQAVKLRLGNGVNYTADFFAFQDGKVYAFEVKGPHAWDDAIVKLKVAATMYPWIAFRLVWRESGAWKTQNILP